MARIFISYRRADSGEAAQKLYAALKPHFQVFMDVEGILVGKDFRAIIEREIIQSDVVLIVIGPLWVSITDEAGVRRLEKLNDLVRIEAEMALRHEKIVIPVTVDGAAMPSAEFMPASLSSLPFLNGERIRPEQLSLDTARLIQQIKRALGLEVEPTPPAFKLPPKLTFRRMIWLIGGLVLVAFVLGLRNLVIQALNPTTPLAPLDTLQAAYAQASAYNYRDGNAAWTPITLNFDGVPMVLVPAGCFDMGSGDGEDSEQPINPQCLDQPFWIDRTEVMQADFERLGGQKANPNAINADPHPVETISWFEARDFCALRGMRLPTEREWEYAARGPDNRTYPWGDDWNPANVVWSENSNGQTVAVGSRPAGASWVNALDMSGNVWEWVSSLYQLYPYVASDGREDLLNSADVRVMRGGSFGSPLYDLRASFRNRNSPHSEGQGLGFRCARYT
jgi:iron(II)-dependent oxidoreductase